MQSGGSFDIDYTVEGPFNKVIMTGQKERQGDFVFTANVPGAYSFCFDNSASTFADKVIDIEIAVSDNDQDQSKGREDKKANCVGPPPG